MRYTLSLLLLLLLAGASAAQQIAPASTSPSPPEDLIVVKFSWQRRLNPDDWDKDLYRTATEAANRERSAHEARKNEIPRKEARPHPSRRHGDKDKLPEVKHYEPEQGAQSFQYRATLKNIGKKTIQVVEWEYVFSGTNGQKEETRHAFVSRKKIKPGESKELLHTTTAPPSRTVNATPGTASDNPAGEGIVITRIEYADGTFWQR